MKCSLSCNRNGESVHFLGPDVSSENLKGKTLPFIVIIIVSTRAPKWHNGKVFVQSLGDHKFQFGACALWEGSMAYSLSSRSCSVHLENTDHINIYAQLYNMLILSVHHTFHV